ncbi:elongation factor P [bacterium]|nr:elongation factor P [bacterium]MBU1937075.1 elongation factor P [bacterium]
MATTAEIRNGLTIEMEGQMFVVTWFQHVKPGKGGAFVRTKLKNVRTGRVIDRTLNAGASITIIRLEAREMQYLFHDETGYTFMDQETFDQIPIGEDIIGEDQKWLKEGEICKVMFHGDQPLSLEVPFFLELKVLETSPPVKGDTVSGSGKPATLETSAVIQVPFFVEQGDTVRVDTRTGEYLDRVTRAK